MSWGSEGKYKKITGYSDQLISRMFVEQRKFTNSNKLFGFVKNKTCIVCLEHCHICRSVCAIMLNVNIKRLRTCFQGTCIEVFAFLQNFWGWNHKLIRTLTPEKQHPSQNKCFTLHVTDHPKVVALVQLKAGSFLYQHQQSKSSFRYSRAQWWSSSYKWESP